MEAYELRQHRMGSTLWQQPMYYLKNSPILNVDQISTPILLMSNAKDLNVSFSQGVEFFTALRRLGKAAWMLQYDLGEHGLDPTDTLSTSDYTKRLSQFFDYYLKGFPLPRWMSKGIPAVLKGFDDGFEFD